MVFNKAYVCTEIEFGEYKRNDFDKKTDSCDLSDNTDNINSSENRIYNYDDALTLAGNGCYNIGLLVCLSLTLLAMTLDMFSFSIIVALSSCDFHLDLTQKSVLMSMPFLGPISMAYGWGYISDTQGRKKVLTIAMGVSFLMSALCAIAPNWIVLAILKLIGTCFCSCAQSVSYALLGESCSERVKRTYMIVMSGTIFFSPFVYFGISYAIVGMEFSFVIPGFITFVPWRLLTLILSLPLGLSALSLLFFYESPTFLLNAGREEEALVLLKKICRRNGRDPEKYPVKKVVLTEVSNIRCAGQSLLKSMWEQTVPLFKRPFLQRTMLLYYLIFVVYVSSNSLFVWLPFLSEAFSAGLRSEGGDAQGLCGLISQTANSTSDPNACISPVELPVVLFASINAIVLVSLNTLMSKLASRRKALTFTILIVSSACCVGTVYIPNNIANIILFFGILLVNLIIGIAFSYCVDLYPTSFRGMASCLGVMVARLSSVAGVNLVGPYIMTHCYLTFHSLTALLLSGAVVACLLPSDRPKKV